MSVLFPGFATFTRCISFCTYDSCGFVGLAAMSSWQFVDRVVPGKVFEKQICMELSSSHHPPIEQARVAVIQVQIHTIIAIHRMRRPR
jgi:hypothetical protein